MCTGTREDVALREPTHNPSAGGHVCKPEDILAAEEDGEELLTTLSVLV